MKKNDFATLQSIYSILGMSITRKHGLFIVGRLGNIPNKCLYQTLKTEDENIINNPNNVLSHFIKLESEDINQ
jgi:hypothetical protein